MTSNSGTEIDSSDEHIDPKIAHHGAYIAETKTILRTYADCQSYDQLKRHVLQENIINKDTDEYRTNILREVSRRYIPSTDTYQETPLIRTLTSDVRTDVVDWCLYYEFAQDPFISLLTREFLFPEFEAGTLSVDSEDVVAFIYSVQDEYSGLRDRSDSTIKEAATKYLSALRNFGLLEGTQRKEFAVTYTPDEAVAYVVYRLFEDGVTSARDIIDHDGWELLLMDESEVQRRVADISPEYVTYEKRGSTERLELAYEDIGTLIDAI